MPTITVTLPDGTRRTFDRAVTGQELAESLSPRLARAALGCVVDGQVRDLGTLIDHDCSVRIVTERRPDGQPDPDALMLMRHSAAHVMAEAIQDVIGRDVQLAYGPPTATGFFYDLAVPPGKAISTEHFEAINRRMAQIIREDRPFTRYELTPDEGLAKLRAEGNKYKLDNALRALSGESGSDGATTLSFYVTGQPGKNWEDLCRGPHVPSTGRIGAACVLSVASAYWRGDEHSDRLTRVYGTAFPTRQELDEYLRQLDEARRRDHRVLGRQLRLFVIDDAVGQGLILWTPRGAVIRQELANFISAELRRQGYEQVFTPHIGRLTLYRTSGHYPYYAESQYPPIVERETLDRLAREGCSCAELANRLARGEVEGYLLKPMNCPHHVRIFASQPRSYRDMPVRLAEFGTVYRWEQSGELSGMTRVRGFTQDDAHLFCMPEQVPAELRGCLELVRIIFRTLGMNDYRVRVGLRDPRSDKYVGDPAGWAAAEQACREAARSLNVPFAEEPGEAAFYGPKIDFLVRDVIGREWQLGTVQVDYNLPERFELEYIGPDNRPHRPVMIHRAPFGSFERFCGMLIEHFAGAFPTWLAPEQVRVLPVSDKSAAYAARVLQALTEAGFRAASDTASERIQARIRSAAEEKVPYLLIVGPRDEAAGTVSVRARGITRDLGALPLERFISLLREEVSTRGGRTVVQHMAPGESPQPRPANADA